MKKILFVCLGNICRSPAAEAIMTSLIKKEKLDKEISCDSAGTSGFHQAQPADSRMIAHAAKRGYQLTSTSRRFDEADFEVFDYIVAMDNTNYNDMKSMHYDKAHLEKLYRMCDFCQQHSEEEVPDPYYGEDGFEKVLDILEDACQHFLTQVKKSI
jgi:protein-tyrosine phosphatase